MHTNTARSADKREDALVRLAREQRKHPRRWTVIHESFLDGRTQLRVSGSVCQRHPNDVQSIEAVAVLPDGTEHSLLVMPYSWQMDRAKNTIREMRRAHEIAQRECAGVICGRVYLEQLLLAAADPNGHFVASS